MFYNLWTTLTKKLLWLLFLALPVLPIIRWLIFILSSLSPYPSLILDSGKHIVHLLYHFLLWVFSSVAAWMRTRQFPAVRFPCKHPAWCSVLLFFLPVMVSQRRVSGEVQETDMFSCSPYVRKSHHPITRGRYLKRTQKQCAQPSRGDNRGWSLWTNWFTWWHIERSRQNAGGFHWCYLKVTEHNHRRIWKELTRRTKLCHCVHLTWMLVCGLVEAAEKHACSLFCPFLHWS